MIYVDVKGNLGNQMFEYAFARMIQEKTGQKICLNTYFLSKYKPEYKLSLDDFVLNENVVVDDTNPLPWFVNTYTGIIRILKGLFPEQFFSIMEKFGAYIWLQVPYKSFEIDKRKNYYLVGYWQCTKYFSNIDNIIRSEFKAKYPIKDENKELYSTICSKESVCVTIRRGDYVTNEKYKKEFFQCDEQYFLEGIKRIRKEIPDATIVFFSDDIEWVKENISVDGEVYYESGNDPVWEKLRLMSACKHFVISNSTFSWWAQHLSNNPNKIVYAPSSWYPDGRKCDIYEKKWRYIDV